jgi:hypothetical protein
MPQWSVEWTDVFHAVLSERVLKVERGSVLSRVQAKKFCRHIQSGFLCFVIQDGD